MNSIFSSVALGWIGRRILDWGGIIGGFLWLILKTYNEMPPPLQEMVGRVIQGHWQELTLGSVVTFGTWAWAQRKSWLATVRPQVVTPDGEKVRYDHMPPAAQREVTATAKAAPRRKTLADMLAEKLGRK